MQFSMAGHVSLVVKFLALPASCLPVHGSRSRFLQTTTTISDVTSNTYFKLSWIPSVTSNHHRTLPSSTVKVMIDLWYYAVYSQFHTFIHTVYYSHLLFPVLVLTSTISRFRLFWFCKSFSVGFNFSGSSVVWLFGCASVGLDGWAVNAWMICVRLSCG